MSTSKAVLPRGRRAALAAHWRRPVRDRDSIIDHPDGSFQSSGRKKMLYAEIVETKGIEVNKVDVADRRITDLVRASTMTRYARMRLGSLCPTNVEMLTQVCPIMVVQHDKRYACIGNRRVLSMVKAKRDKKKKVTATILPVDLDDGLIRHIALVDVFVLPMLYAVKKAIKPQLERAKRISESDASSECDGIIFRGRKIKLKSGKIASVDREGYGMGYRFEDVAWLTTSTLKLLLYLSPPWLLKNDAGDYACRLNRRVCEVATSGLGTGETIEARIPGRDVPEKTLADFETGMIEPLHLLWKGGAHSLANIYSDMNDDDKALVFNDEVANIDLARSLGYSRGNMFSPFGVSRIDPGDDDKTEDLSQYQIGTREGEDGK